MMWPLWCALWKGVAGLPQGSCIKVFSKRSWGILLMALSLWLTRPKPHTVNCFSHLFEFLWTSIQNQIWPNEAKTREKRKGFFPTSLNTKQPSQCLSPSIAASFGFFTVILLLNYWFYGVQCYHINAFSAVFGAIIHKWFVLFFG